MFISTHREREHTHYNSQTLNLNIVYSLYQSKFVGIVSGGNRVSMTRQNNRHTGITGNVEKEATQH